MQHGDEQVFVVRREDFFGPGGWPQGFLALDAAAAAAQLAAFARRGFFAPRRDAEQDPRLKQLIPYCVLREPGAVFCVQRKAAQSEVRLHGKLSIGIGGHVNPEPDYGATGVVGGHGPALFAAALRRELTEELHGVDGRDPAPCFRGLLNDDDTPVGRVHVGLVYTIDLPAALTPAERPGIREISKMSGGFRSLVEVGGLWQDSDRFETWSRMLVAAGLAGATAVSRPNPSEDPAARGHDATTRSTASHEDPGETEDQAL